MKQNKYDVPQFFLKYSQMNRSKKGLSAAGEWMTFRAMLPDLRDKRVLDLGCGFGWHCRYAQEQHAEAVLGVDLSAKMLERARADTQDPAIQYCQLAIESIDFPENTFDVVISSLALHYVQDFSQVCHNVARCLSPDGDFVFSVEHPIFTADVSQDWCYGSAGERRHWVVDHYHEEGRRDTQFLGEEVVKYHRTVATYMNDLIASGFHIRDVQESKSTIAMFDAAPQVHDESRRPMFLLVAARKGLF